MDYTKIKATFRERLLFLFTGLLPKKYIVTENRTISISQPKQEEKDDINNIEETKQATSDFKIDVPFFDLENGKTKSNL